MPRNLDNVYSSDERLTAFSLYLGNMPEDFIALQVCPEYPVDRELFKYYKHNLDAARTPPADGFLRGPGSPAHIVDFSLTTASGTAFEYAVETDIHDEERQWSDPGLDPEQDATAHLNEQRLLDTEIRFRNAVDATTDHHSGNSTTLSGTSQWSDYTNSTPLTDVSDGHVAIYNDIGRPANVAWTRFDVIQKLLWHPDILSALGRADTMMATLEDLRRLFQVDMLYVARSRVNAAKEGAADSMGAVWGKDFYLAYVNPNPSRRSLTFGWHAVRPVANSTLSDVTETRRIDDRETALTDAIRRRYSGTFNDVAMGSGATYFIEDCIA